MTLQEGILFGMGNPLLDFSAVVSPKFLREYGLKPNETILAKEGTIVEMLYRQLVNKYKDTIEYSAGGSTQNSLRVAQWILKTPHLTTYMGAVGKSNYAKILRAKAEDDGVLVRYQETDLPTGTCAVLITGTVRSLYTYLSAAEHFTIDHFDQDDNWAFVEKAKYYYVEGFFLTVSPDSIQKVAQFACENNRCFAMSLSASFIPKLHAKKLNAVLPYVDILFGNEKEAKAFSLSHQFGTDNIIQIAKKTCKLPKKNPKRPRIVIFTQGYDNVIVVSDYTVQEFPVEKIEDNLIVDSNGTGDAFVGGFLSQYIQEKEIEKCVKCGIWAASKIIQRSGCTFDTDIQYSE